MLLYQIKTLDILSLKLDNRLQLIPYCLVMKPNYFIHLIFASFLSLVSINSYAAQWYHVELVVFEQLNSATNELSPTMTNIASGKAAQLILPATNGTLLTSASRLNKSSRYRVHYHNSWKQSIMKKRGAQYIKINSKNAMVEGSIRLYKSTYLHAALDLWLKENSGNIASWSDGSPNGESFNVVRNPNLKESRRIRSKKLYYFDHPRMGALLQLTPIKTPSPAQEKEESLESFSLPAEATSTSAQ